MSFETKVILVAIGEIVQKSKDTKEVYQALERMAKIEGIELAPFLDNPKKEDQK